MAVQEANRSTESSIVLQTEAFEINAEKERLPKGQGPRNFVATKLRALLRPKMPSVVS